NPVVLDSLVKKEFDHILENGLYSYGVYLDTASTIVLGNYAGDIDELIQSPHQESLTCICQDENYMLALYIPNQRTMLLSKIIILPVMSGLFLMVLLFSFFLTLYFIFRQKKLSEMKTDFVNNMTHELKTPIATISVSAEMLNKEMVIHSPEKIQKYSRIISEENSRLKKMVERVLQIAIIDKEDYQVKLSEYDIHKIILECVNKYNVQVKERKGCIIANLEAKQHSIKTDHDHLMNILYNLLDNANKYSPESPHITINTLNLNSALQITIKDKGIGISKENQKTVFRKFERLQHGDIHDVKGYGIGLFYVKTMVEKLGGKIELQSELNAGSSFILSFPV
ncbi:MAG: HAMP domain-containing histidine kinase, partial [Bacteroidetes bacterium]|nr:HAMP domain-containing histidine kinase [Bacteroidota bacterium]